MLRTFEEPRRGWRMIQASEVAELRASRNFGLVRGCRSRGPDRAKASIYIEGLAAQGLWMNRVCGLDDPGVCAC